MDHGHASMIFCDRFKHAFKTALAVVIAYGIALHMDWSKPLWAGWTAFSTSLMKHGEGIQKSLNRLAGAFVDAVAGFVLLALFIQDRWLFMTFLSLFSGVSTYLAMSSKRYDYFWQQAGFFAGVSRSGSTEAPHGGELDGSGMQ